MNIVDKRNTDPKVKFEELNSGEVFEYGGVVHMATTIVGNGLGTIMCNAVVLSTGVTKRFNDSDLVTLLNCKLIIEQQEVK